MKLSYSAQLAQDLTKLETTHEKPEVIESCLEHCIAQFKALPVHVRRHSHEGIPSAVISNAPGKIFDVILLGHIDTVPGHPELFAGTIQDGKLFGRGTLDMKAFVATNIAVAKAIMSEGTDLKIAVAIVADEELGGTHGARHLVDDLGYKADVVLVPDDGEGINRLVVASKHIFKVEFTATGVESHAARPWKGKNAIQMLMRTHDRLARNITNPGTTPEDMWVNTMNLGVINGGIASNEVPGSAKMTIDIRITPDSTTSAQVHEWIRSSLEPGVTYNVEMEGHPTVVDPTDPVVAEYIACIESVTGRPVVMARHGGGTDGRYFARRGMRVIVHQGTGADCQSDNEHVELSTLDQLVEIQKRFLQKVIFPTR